MKILMILVLAVLLALLAIWALPVLKGYVLIRADGWAVEMNLFVLLCLILAIYLLGRLAIWAWFLPGNTVRAFFERRAAAQLEIGMLALSEGDWRKAEKALSKAARNSDQSALGYIGAAQAAHGKGDGQKMEAYLESADQSARAHDSVLITRASLRLASGDPQAALDTLAELSRSREMRPRVLEIKARCFEELGHWPELAELAPQLERAEIIDSEQRGHLENRAALAGINQADDVAKLILRYKALSKAQRSDEAYATAYVRRAIALNAASEVVKDASAALDRNWSEALLMAYAQASGDAPGAAQLEKWLKRHPDSAGLHLLLGRHCIQAELWGKAREHLETAVQLDPSPAAYAQLGELEASQGQLETALTHYREAHQRTEP